MGENAVYGVWLQQALGEGSRKVTELLEYFGSCKGVFDADEQEIRLSGILGTKELPRFLDTGIDVAEEIVEACDRLGYGIMTPDDETFPERLRCIAGCPAAMYISGKLPDIDDEVCIAMVGTRSASQYGYSTAKLIARDLAAAGAVIISGCAKGIDTAAHQGALIAEGRTIAVLGCGINARYNMENKSLRQVISSTCAVISEYPPGSPPMTFHFPIRNRIISALSLGVIVVEAGMKSGSLITANAALEQGKDVFAVPGRIDSSQSEGSNRLIYDGAIPINSAEDVLTEYAVKFSHKLDMSVLRGRNLPDNAMHASEKTDAKADRNPGNAAKPHNKRVAGNTSAASGTKSVVKEPDTVPGKTQSDPDVSLPPADVSANARRVWEALDASPKRFHELLSEVGINSSELSRCLTELELCAAVCVFPGNKYTKA